MSTVLDPNQYPDARWGPTYAGTSKFFDTNTLGLTGTYTIKVDPDWLSTGAVTNAIATVPPDPTTTLTIGGGAQTLTITTPGQNATATFDASAGQQVPFASPTMGSDPRMCGCTSRTG
jgi:hypothetical protein